MKMSVSVPKDLSKRVEWAAHQLGISPSEVVRRAMREFVETLTPAPALDGGHASTDTSAAR